MQIIRMVAIVPFPSKVVEGPLGGLPEGPAEAAGFSSPLGLGPGGACEGPRLLQPSARGLRLHTGPPRPVRAMGKKRSPLSGKPLSG